MSKASDYLEKYKDAVKIQPMFPFNPSIGDGTIDFEVRAELTNDGGIRLFKSGINKNTDFTMRYEDALKLAEWIFKTYQDE